MGYYPVGTFTNPGLRDGATKIWWGGEVVNSDPASTTQTDMGSGRFASDGYQYAAFFRRMKQRPAGEPTEDFVIRSSPDTPGCSTGLTHLDNPHPGGPFWLGVNPSWDWRTYAFLGGPNYQPAYPTLCVP
jgi:hypothetical protein